METGATPVRRRLAAACCLLLCTTALLPAATLTVTSTANSGNGTLRQAILNANTNANLDTIAFNISGGAGVKIITPTAALPPITSPVIIDGTTQPLYTGATPLIELNGTNAGAAIGLELRGGGSIIRGLTINRFQFPGIVIQTNGNNVIERCFIGTDSSGTNARGNGIPTISDGIAIFSPGNLIGGSSPLAGNVISGNGRYGIGLIGSLAQGNRIEANAIGTDLNAMKAIPNRDGIGVLDAPSNTIGGVIIFLANIISGNTEEGIEIGGANAVGNSVEGNYIGLDATGQAPLPNGGNGILISSNPLFTGPAAATMIGGSGQGNTISGNGRDGIQMGFGTTSNQVTGNAIGLSEDGLVVVPNGRHGVSIFDSTNNAITSVAGVANSVNYIIANRSNGVFIGRGALNAASISNVVQGNTIAQNGLDGVQLGGGAYGNRVVGSLIGAGQGLGGVNYLGNSRHGVSILDSTNNLIGGSLSTERNYISGNLSNGVFIGTGDLGSGSVSNSLRGNRIGTTPIGNGGVGVFVQGNWNSIGGTNAGEGNLIAYNGASLTQRGHGVVIASGEHNPILGNMVWTNSGRGIDLGNDSFTVNDIADGDTGANDLQNYPVVTRVAFYPSYGFHNITWTLNSKTNRSYRIEWFANAAPDSSGLGEGQRPLGATIETTDAKGFVVFTNSFADADQFISVTATDLQDFNTSEFSPVDTDGDAIADAWEMTGIDFNEDGTNDLKLVGADLMYKDIYVEIDAMSTRVPDMNNLLRVLSGTIDPRTGGYNGDGFLSAPNDKVQNPNGQDGILVHMELDETNLPFAPWPDYRTNGFLQFDLLKTNHFGTLRQQTNSHALRAKSLIYRYCIFADTVPGAAGVTRTLGANDFFMALGANSSSPTDDFVPTAFMHELGHTLGLDHGGQDGDNFKPNYHSVMNYCWLSSSGGNDPWTLGFSRERFGTLNKTNLDEALGIGASDAHEGHQVRIGPHLDGTNKVGVTKVLEAGPVDWNTNRIPDEMQVARDLNYLSGTNPPRSKILLPSEDWSQLRYYFLDNAYATRVGSGELTNDLSPTVLEELDKLGTGTGSIQFSQASYGVSETNGMALISVSRIFEAEGTVSVSFSTFNGTATNGLDYVATNGVLTFTGAETNKTFAIPILNDGVAEEPETIRLILTSPTGGASLGPRSQATLTIIDDELPGRFTVGNTNDSGAGSLRQAILDANSATGLALVDFNIPSTNGLTISPTSALPPITHPMTIDGTTQPGFAGAPIIELNGASAGALSDGLQIRAGNSTLRGLVINRCNGSGIKLMSGGGNRVEGCYLGLNRQGTLGQGNAGHGVFVDSANNVIGGSAAAARNFISGNNSLGILLSFGSVFDPPATNNQVLGNVIGLGVDGSDQGNTFDGMQIYSSGNIVGGTTAGARNVISGNGTDGIIILAGAGCSILGNYIGTDLTGTLNRSNNGNGITLRTSRHAIGGNKAGAGNVISGNGRAGIELSGTNTVILGNRIGTDAAGRGALPNLSGGITLSGSGNQIGDTTPFGANTIAFNRGPGVLISFGANNPIRGNSIFANTNAAVFTETLGIDLAPQGISLNDTNDTDVGANELQNFPLLASASNSLAGTFITGSLNSRPNTNFTLDFYASAAPDPSGFGEGQAWIGSADVTTDGGGNATFSALPPAIYLSGRLITATATDAAGNTSEFSPAVFAEASLPGRTFTVENVNDSGPGSLRQAMLDANAYRSSSERDTIEFSIPGFGVQTIRPLTPLPVIEDPVLIDGYTQPGASPNTALAGHNGVLLIELDGSLAGITYGLQIKGGDSIVRGLVINRFGTGAALFDQVGGIHLSARGGNRIEGNFIGTDPTGLLERGNFTVGVFIAGSSNHVIGSVSPAQRNVISGTKPIGSGDFIRTGNGIMLDSRTANNRIEGNLIGTAADGVTAMGNAGFGIDYNAGEAATNTTIGGTLPGSGNVIAFNGVLLANNSFLSDGGGIDDGANAPGTAILGNSIHSNLGLGIKGDLINSAEGRGNFPFLSSVFSSNGLTTIQGRLNSVSNAPHRIEFFANDVLDPSSHGEGKLFLGATNVPTDANGFVAFTAVLPVAVSNGTFLSATATDDRNNTSEFSPRLTVGDVLTNVIVVNSINEVDDGVANTNHTSLREAICAANNHTGPDTIRFAIGTGARTIAVSDSQPAIMDAGTTMDATTQPGFAGKPLIYLDGQQIAANGLRLYSDSNTVRGLAINRFNNGIYCTANGNVIEGCYLGMDLTGATGGGYQNYGIYFSFASSNRVGGTTVAARNLIAGNNRAAIRISNSSGNRIAGNFIGTDVTGTNGLVSGPATLAGIYLDSATATVIGGDTPGARNVIAANSGSINGGGSGTIVQGNFIGADVTGRTNLGGGFVSLGGSGLLVKDNLITGPRSIRLQLGGSDSRVEGNLIGTDATGSSALGFVGTGILVSGRNNLIGGTNISSRNLLSGQYNGLVISGPSNIVQGNFIGTKLDGVSPLGNVGDGVVVSGSFNLIGGIGANVANTVAFNSGNGISVPSGANNALLGNSIFSNTGLGIDLGISGVTTNDPGDLDAGANNLQNFPILSSVRNIGSATLIAGTLNSRSNTSYRIEFFANTNCHSSGFGQGRTFLNSTIATTDPSGNAAISFTHPVPIPAGQKITATATDPDNNTSEFSPCVTVINDTNYVVLSFTTASPYTLSWPTSAVNFLLERATNLAPPAVWLVISNGITTNAGNKVFVFTNDPALPTLFFRLRRP